MKTIWTNNFFWVAVVVLGAAGLIGLLMITQSIPATVFSFLSLILILKAIARWLKWKRP